MRVRASRVSTARRSPRRSSAARSAAIRHGATFVDVTGRFAGHGLNAPDSWIFALRLPNGEIDRRAFHPSAVGYEVYARAVIVVLRQVAAAT